MRFTSPAPTGADDHYLDPRYDPPFNPPSSPGVSLNPAHTGLSGGPSSTHLGSGYQLEDEGYANRGEETGDIPLLGRTMPGGYRQGAGGRPMSEAERIKEEDDNYIHYGRIPQRVPRRFKTTKKIQCVSPRYLHS